MIICRYSLAKGNATAEKMIFLCLDYSWDVSETLFIGIEEYICVIYNAKNETVNPARARTFSKNIPMKKKIIGFSYLPLCEPRLLLHIKHEHYVGTLWEKCLDRDLALSKIKYQTVVS